MYGSDAPFHDPGVEIRKVEVSGLDAAARARVLGLNARKLFFGSDDAPVSAQTKSTQSEERVTWK
jgi:predicted TIM-barrel fold metal-dependent hydrolase